MGNSVDFVAIDFETANNSRASACAVGLVKVSGGEVVDRLETLIRPSDEHSQLNAINFSIHGIARDSFMTAPSILELSEELFAFIGEFPLVAHNAIFDRSCFARSVESWGLSLPPFEWLCTLTSSKKYLKLPYYKLPFVVEALGLPEFDHHNSLSDAEACTAVALSLLQENNLTNINQLEKPGFFASRGTREKSESEIEILAQTFFESPENQVNGLNISFTGTIGIGQREGVLVPLVKGLGATWDESPKKGTDIVVVGNQDPNYLRVGMTMSIKHEKAEKLQAKFQKLEILDEVTFRALLPGDLLEMLATHK